MCYELFEKYGVENCKIYLVELYPCKSKEELESREGYYIRNYECINKNIPCRTSKEYYNDHKHKKKEYYNNNKDKIAKYTKEWYDNNKDEINTKRKVQYECPCGGRYTHSNKSQHSKTKKHMEYIEEPKK